MSWLVVVRHLLYGLVWFGLFSPCLRFLKTDDMMDSFVSKYQTYQKTISFHVPGVFLSPSDIDLPSEGEEQER